MDRRKLLAGAFMLLSLLLIGIGVYREELIEIWNNGKLLCLTCIGIK
ncbi:MAG: thioredoxin [Desulfurobacteriaceae bacterium]